MENYLVSARKYRPSTFQTVVGQKALTATLKNAIATGRLAHSYLFCGSRGVGKTSCARIMAKTINCEHPTADGEACNECQSCRQFNAGNSLNIIELDAASNNGVDDIRIITEQVQIPPVTGRYRVFIIDEVHMLTPQAFNAFLKTLEEPPSYVVFILATTEKHKILPTILSRCQIYDFSRITIQDMIDHMQYVASCEGITAEPAALNIIARKADGAMRDALSIFDQVAASCRGNITYQATLDNLNVLDYEYYNQLVAAFLEGDVARAWLIYGEIREKGFDSQFFINGLAQYFRDLMVARDPATLSLLEAGDEARQSMAEWGSKCSPAFLYRAMDLCNDADLNYRIASNKQFLIELTLAKICQLQRPFPDQPTDGNGKGLKKIAVTAQQQPNQTAQTAQTNQTTPQAAPQQQQQAAPQAQAAAQPQPSAPQPAPARAAAPQPVTPPRPAAAPRPMGPAGGRLSLRGVAKAPEAAAAAADKPKARTQVYTDAQLLQAWRGFADLHPTEHMLINTMRSSLPARQEGSLHLLVMVENEHQVALLQDFMPQILKHLHDNLSNDTIAIDLAINEGDAAPVTWTEHQVLEHLKEQSPYFNDFMNQLNLTLL